jgi:hypothetical protein
MAGAYCGFCGRRCFVDRVLPDDARGRFAGRSLHMATCVAGAQHDREACGYDYRTAINPLAPAEEV